MYSFISWQEIEWAHFPKCQTLALGYNILDVNWSYRRFVFYSLPGLNLPILIWDAPSVSLYRWGTGRLFILYLKSRQLDFLVTHNQTTYSTLCSRQSLSSVINRFHCQSHTADALRDLHGTLKGQVVLPGAIRSTHASHLKMKDSRGAKS